MKTRQEKFDELRSLLVKLEDDYADHVAITRQEAFCEDVEKLLALGATLRECACAQDAAEKARQRRGRYTALVRLVYVMGGTQASVEVTDNEVQDHMRREIIIGCGADRARADRLAQKINLGRHDPRQVEA